VTIETHALSPHRRDRGGVSGDAIHVVATGSGNVTVQTFGAVTGISTNAGSDGISVTGGGSGNTLIHTFAR